MGADTMQGYDKLLFCLFVCRVSPSLPFPKRVTPRHMCRYGITSSHFLILYTACIHLLVCMCVLFACVAYALCLRKREGFAHCVGSELILSYPFQPTILSSPHANNPTLKHTHAHKPILFLPLKHTHTHSAHVHSTIHVEPTS